MPPKRALEEDGEKTQRVGDDYTWLDNTKAEQDLLAASNRGGQFPTDAFLAFFKERRVADSVAHELVSEIRTSPLFSPGFQDDNVMGRWSPTHKALVSRMRALLLTDPDAMGPCPHPDPARKGAIMCKDVTFNDALMAVAAFKASKHYEAQARRQAALARLRKSVKTTAVGA